MADIIDLLERMGQDSRLRHASRAMLERAMSETQMSPRVRSALVSGDRTEIEVVLGVDNNVCCMVFVPTPSGDEQDAPADERQKAA
jgi:hypothetical protein